MKSEKMSPICPPNSNVFTNQIFYMKSNINFYLREKNKKGVTPIIMKVSFDGRRVKVSTGLKIDTKYWHGNKQEAKSTYDHCIEVNNKLSDLKRAAEKVVIQYSHLDDAGIRKRIDIELYGDKENKKKDFHTFVKDFLDSPDSTLKASTVKSYDVVYKRLKAFEEWNRQTITFEDIDMDFYKKLKKYCYDVADYTDNTFGATIKILKTLLNAATERGYNTNLTFRKRAFKKIQVEVDTIYLNTKELDILYDFDFSATPHLERVRDLFLVGCYSGLRFSDFTNIKLENIDENFIRKNTQKVSENVVIPIHPRVKAIINKYKDITDNSLPEATQNQPMNRCLKEMGKLVGFDDDVIITVSKKNKKTEVIKKKYELICTHTARRSFATNAYLAGIPSIAIMKITAHKTEKNFLNYIKVSQEENAIQLMNHPFFKENSTAA